MEKKATVKEVSAVNEVSVVGESPAYEEGPTVNEEPAATEESTVKQRLAVKVDVATNTTYMAFSVEGGTSSRIAPSHIDDECYTLVSRWTFEEHVHKGLIRWGLKQDEDIQEKEWSVV